MVRTLECPNCGGTVEIKYERTLNAVCIQCLSVLDASTPSLQILQKFAGKQRYQPKIPLGTRGKLATGEYEAIGFQIRSITVDGVVYSWAEYLLYNPYKGYRYLTEYNGHWNDIRTLRAIASAHYQRIKAGGNLRREDIHTLPNRPGANVPSLWANSRGRYELAKR